MPKTAWMLVALVGLAVMPALAADGEGLRADPDRIPWARWHGRLSVDSSAPAQAGLDAAPLKLGSASVMGDYYFSRSMGTGSAGGFRATSGLIFGPRALLSTGQPGLAAASPFSIGTRLFGSGPGATARETSGEVATLPYMGVGYTGLSVRNGWSFSADLGLVAQNPGGLKLIRSQSLDDAVREMRLAPLLQFGVSYAF